MSTPDLPAQVPVAKPNGVLFLLIRLVALGTMCASIMGSFSAWHQVFDLFSHFRCQYFVLLGLCTVALWWRKSPRLAIPATILTLHNAVLIGPYYLPRSPAEDTSEKLSLVSFNVHTANRNSQAVLEYLQSRDPDLILLIEVDERWIRELNRLEARYPHRVVFPAPHNFGLAVYSKLPITRQDVSPLGPNQSTSICLELDFHGQTIGFLGTHPYPPMLPSRYCTRNAQLKSVAERAKSMSVPTIVAGDFNATPWCVGLQPLYEAGLIDSALGFGLQLTWNSKIPLLWIPIDHVLVSQEFQTLRRTVGPHCGSDHYAVEAELLLPHAHR